MLKYLNKLNIYFFALLVLILLIIMAERYLFRRELCLLGETMGTTYDIKIICGPFISERRLQKTIDYRLAAISNSFSTYDGTSEISKFNSMTSLKQRFYPSDDFLTLLFISKKIYEITGGVWDPTVDSIVNAWGFGRESQKNYDLEPTELKSLLNNIGFSKAILFSDDGSISKGFVGASIDFASIAKGFGVDCIALLLQKKGFENFLIEIGGEVYAKGLGQDGRSWRVGISYPDKTVCSNKVCKVISLSNKAIATSGDYRNFLVINGENYSHIIDPRTGYPVSNGVTSVSVIAENCTLADALATALMVINDPKDSVALINTLPEVECVIIFVEENGFLRSYGSSGIKFLS